MKSRFDLPPVNVPDLGSESSTPKSVDGAAWSDQAPEVAAEMLHAVWQLGEQPTNNLILLLESKGDRVYSLTFDAEEVDAFSMWSGGRPFMLLNTFKSPERCRFDAAHELDHLVMHQHGHPQSPDLEREANAFAPVFLMPRASVLASAPRSVTLNSLIKFKRVQAVSVAALNYRLHSLGLSTDWTYRTLCIQIA